MRYLGLDLGTKTLGVSVSDKTNTLVTPLPVIRFSEDDYESLVSKVKELVLKYDIGVIALGLPKNMDGSLGFASKRSEDFKKLLESIGLKVCLVDERLTTKSAIDLMHMQSDNTKNTKYKIDSVAASIILESYMRGIKNDITE